MKSIPAEFSDAIEQVPSVPRIRDNSDRVRWFPELIRPSVRLDLLRLLESQIGPHLKDVRSPIDPATITGMKRNYSDLLPKSMHNSSVMLDQPRQRATRIARTTGLVTLLTSQSLRNLAERVSGFGLEPSPGLQVIRYQSSDYVGTHNDHHPEEKHLRDGYVDLQITLTNDDVERQYLLYERDGFFNQSVNVGIRSGVSVSVLPFWHQVTPLIAKPGREKTALRWLLLVSFVIRDGR